MAITLVGAEAHAVSGPYSTTDSITINLPAGTQAGDVLCLSAGIMRPNIIIPRYTRLVLTRVHTFAIPPTWNLLFARGPTYGAAVPHVSLFRKVATPADIALGAVTLPVTRVIRDTIAPVEDDHMDLTAQVTAHRGADPYQWDGPFEANLRGIETIRAGGGGGGGYAVMPTPPAPPRAEVAGGVAVQFSFVTAGDLGSSAPVPAVPTPVPTVPSAVSSQPDEWDVLAQESTLAPAADGSAFRGVALEATDLNPGVLLWAPIDIPLTLKDHHGAVMTVLRDTGGPPVDAPPEPGQIGVTGSGWLLAEWAGRQRVIDTPLRCEVLAEIMGDDGLEVGVILGEDDAAEPVALDCMFNGLGACTSAVAQFPAPPGFVPYQHALRFKLRTTGMAEEDESTTWWVGVVTNVREEGGLYHVDLSGLWSLLNEARVTLEEVDPQDPESDMQVGEPELPGVILATRILNNGDYREKEIKAPADEQQSWGNYLNAVFRETPSAAWGVGPDQTFVMGLPENGGVLTLDAHAEEVMSVTAGEYLLPPFVTQWWATTSDGDLVTGQGINRGLLTPERVTQAQLDEADNLLVPKESQYLSYEGPSHVIEVAGIAVPPLQFVSLPNGGSQFVASARVSINVGEEGSMPRITTTLTTVALPYEKGGP